MPIYEYSCPDCGLKFELLRPMSRADEAAACPSCDKSAQRVLSRFASFSKSAEGTTSLSNPCAPCSATSCATCKP